MVLVPSGTQLQIQHWTIHRAKKFWGETAVRLSAVATAVQASPGTFFANHMPGIHIFKLIDSSFIAPSKVGLSVGHCGGGGGAFREFSIRRGNFKIMSSGTGKVSRLQTLAPNDSCRSPTPRGSAWA